MDELEFRKRVYADPHQLDQEILDAASTNPRLQRILDETTEMEDKLRELLLDDVAPESLRARLLALPGREPDNPDLAASSATNSPKPWYRHFALAASLVLAVGASASFFVDRGPNAAELAFGNEVIAHIYHEAAEIDAINAGTLLATFSTPVINQVMANSGSHLNNVEFLQQMPVRYANPCLIASPYNSSHLILQSRNGAIHIIAADNEPVRREFPISDERFSGIVVPLGNGNLIVIGEKNQDLDNFRDLFSENLEWQI